MKTTTTKKTATATQTPADVKAIEQHVERLEAADAADAKAAKKKTASKATTDLRKAKNAMDPKNAKANSNGAKPGTKTATIIALLERKGGATAAELLKATGWQAHSLRGFISVLGKKGRPAKSTTNKAGERTYAL